NIFPNIIKYYECPKCYAHYDEERVPFIEISNYNPSQLLLDNMDKVRKCFDMVDILFEHIKALNIEVEKNVVERLNHESYFWDILTQFKSRKKSFKLTVNTFPLVKEFDSKVMDWLFYKKNNSKTNFYIVVMHLDLTQSYMEKLLNNDIYVLKAGESISELTRRLNFLLTIT
ncbi:MAG: hypothetical protein RMJ31_07495, partial [Nitrososphaerota archaeon]|nr:hypothetical protein [Nitrososphaerota archaeon]